MTFGMTLAEHLTMTENELNMKVAASNVNNKGTLMQI